MSALNYWICELALLGSGLIYVYTIEKREENKKRLIVDIILFLACMAIVNQMPITEIAWMELTVRIAGFCFLIHFLRVGRVLKWYAAIYYAIWAFISWQLLYELWLICNILGQGYLKTHTIIGLVVETLIFASGHIIMGVTVGKWMPDGGKKKIGPRQLTLALLTFMVFQGIVFVPVNFEEYFTNGRWVTIYLCQVLLALLLYTQNEAFKNGDIKRELEAMNLLWKKEKEQYQISKENMEIINQKAHDLKHLLQAIRNSGQDGIDRYLNEIEESVLVYESIVKTGNDVLDTILTEKSLYCKEKGIIVSCVADGSQLSFMDTVDLYTILGNAMDNAIEAVEKLTIPEMRQIDVMIYRQQQFLAINIINPMAEKLTFEDEFPVTTKDDAAYHGYGLRSMNYIVKRYDGCMNISDESGCFSLMILIPIPSST